jgi:hypothetical protein
MNGLRTTRKDARGRYPLANFVEMSKVWLIEFLVIPTNAISTSFYHKLICNRVSGKPALEPDTSP